MTGDEAPFVRHANPVTQAGFTQIPNAVMLRHDLRPLPKLVYGYLKHRAWRGETDQADPPLAEMASDLGVSENAIREAIRDLCKAPAAAGSDSGPMLLESVRRGLGLPNVYVINDPLPSGGENTTTGTAESGVLELRNLEIPPLTQELVVQEKVLRPHTSDFMGQKNRPVTVDRKRVTDREFELAQSILTFFNAHAGANFAAKTWITKIVSRIREHPELSLEAHEVVIARAFAAPWWRGAPTPSVVYGNDAQFEKSVAEIRVDPTATRGMTPEEMESWAGDA